MSTDSYCCGSTAGENCCGSTAGENCAAGVYTSLPPCECSTGWSGTFNTCAAGAGDGTAGPAAAVTFTTASAAIDCCGGVTGDSALVTGGIITAADTAEFTTSAGVGLAGETTAGAAADVDGTTASTTALTDEVLAGGGVAAGDWTCLGKDCPTVLCTCGPEHGSGSLCNRPA